MVSWKLCWKIFFRTTDQTLSMEVLLALTRLLMRYDMIYTDIWRMKDIQQNIEMVTTSGGVDSCHGREWWHSDFLLLGEVLEILITKIMKFMKKMTMKLMIHTIPVCSETDRVLTLVMFKMIMLRDRKKDYFSSSWCVKNIRDGEEGYPGDVLYNVRYSLDQEGGVRIDFTGVTLDNHDND